jgi:excisionase family DNA binding protein
MAPAVNGEPIAASGPDADIPPASDVLTAEQAATFLGVSRWTLYASANRHEVPHRRLGRRMLFSRRALLLWLEGASPRSAGKE